MPSLSPVASTVDRLGPAARPSLAGSSAHLGQASSRCGPSGPAWCAGSARSPGRAHRQRLPAHDARPYPSRPARLAGLLVSSRMRADAEVDQDLRAGAVVAGVGRQPSSRLASTVSRPASCSWYACSLCSRPMPAALVPAHVEHDAAALGGDRGQRGVQLRPAVAAQRAEHVAGQALGVHPDQHVLAVAEVAVDQRDVLGVVEVGARSRPRGTSPCSVGSRASATRSTCRSVRRRYAMRSAMEISASPCSSAKRAQLRQAHHGAVVVDQLAEHAGRPQPGEPGQVDRGLGVPGAAQHAAVAWPAAARRARAGSGRSAWSPGRPAAGSCGPARRRRCRW